MNVRPDDAVGSDADVAFDNTTRLDDSVVANGHGDVDARLQWINNRDATQHDLFEVMRLNVLTHLGQLDSVVDTNRLLNGQTAFGGDLMSFHHQDSRTIGEIVFGLNIVRL